MTDSPTIEQQQVMNNSLSGLAYSFGGSVTGYGNGYGAQLSQTDTLRLNNRWNFISNDRALLNELYVEHGIVQTLVDQPVDDAYRSGLEIRSGQLDAEQLEQLYTYCEMNSVFREIMQARKWARLFGGGAVIVITDQDPATPLNIDRISERSKIAFRGVDMWELYDPQITADTNQNLKFVPNNNETFDYYGRKIHKSRVFPMRGKEAPSLVRPRFRGWGMSEIERLIRSMNQYIKNQDVIFELMDEAKIDIYKIDGFNTALATIKGTGLVQQRIQHANLIKNYNNAITMDMKDEYQQKQMSFTGLAEMLVQIRYGVAADMKFPMTKLWGMSAAGFSSGEEDTENYNSMVEGEVRAKDKFIVIGVLRLVCQHLFGMAPDDLTITWNPLRILSSEQQEKVNDAKFKRIMDAYERGLADDKEAKMAVNKAGLLPIELNEKTEAIDMDADDEEDESPQLEDKSKDKTKKKVK